jgi:hypothetical protein
MDETGVHCVKQNEPDSDRKHPVFSLICGIKQRRKWSPVNRRGTNTEEEYWRDEEEREGQ